MHAALKAIPFPNVQASTLKSMCGHSVKIKQINWSEVSNNIYKVKHIHPSVNTSEMNQPLFAVEVSSCNELSFLYF